MATFPGTNANDTLLGGADNDSIQGFQGNDYLVGNAGNDTILGAKGDDVIYGGDGNDSLVGAQNNDIVQGGADNDTLDETGDTGVMNTTTGEFLPGGSNLLAGNAGNDTIWGGTGSDTIQGGQGNDLLLGNGGNDAIYTGMGTDIVFGGQGGDTINIASNNTATTLYYNTSMTNVDGVDTINGFVVGTDKITLISLNATANQKLDVTGLNALALTGTNLSTAIANALASQETDGTDRILTLDNGTTLILKGIGADLTGSSFNGFVGQALTVPPTSVLEGNSGTSSLTFNLTLSQPPSAPLTVNYQTLTTGTATAGTDFSAANTSVIFAAGETTKTVTINVIGDTASESDETVKVLFSGTGIDSVTATGTITNDDVAQTYTLVSDISTVQEGSAATFTVTATSGPVATATSLTYNIAGDTNGGALPAASSADFGVMSGTVTIAAGATTGTFTVTPASDGVSEGLEGFKVSLFDGSATNVASSSSLLITDGAVLGQTFQLTAGADNKVGDTGDDRFEALLSGSSMTFGSADTISGAAGNDTLMIDVNGASTYRAASLTSVESIVVNFSNTGTINLLGSTGVTSVESNSSSASSTFSNIGSTSVALAASAVGNTALTYGFVPSSVVGTNDTATLSLAGVAQTGGTATTINGIETLAIASSAGANSLGTLTADSLTKITVTGDQNLNLGIIPASVATIDANAFTGALTAALGAVSNATVTGGAGNDSLTVSAVLANVSVNGGAGNDTIIAAANLTATDSIDGGSGTADALSTTNALANVLDGSTPTTYTITNIEQVTISDTLDGLLVVGNISATVDTVNLTYAAVAASLMTGGDVITGPEGSLTVNLGGSLLSNAADMDGFLTVNSTGTATTDSLTLANKAINSTTALNINVFNGQAVTSTGYENVTVNTGAVASGAQQTISTLMITPDVASTNVSLTLTGTNAFQATTTTTSTGLLTINASGLSAQPAGSKTLDIASTSSGALGTQSITGSSGEDSIIIGNFAATIDGGASNDTITGGSANDSLIGGAGADTITTNAGNNTVSGGDGNDTITAGAGIDSIAAGDGNDSIVMAGNLTSADTIDGGLGTNSLTIASAGFLVTSFANVSNVQQVGITSNTLVTLAAPISATTTTFDLSEAAVNKLTLASGYTGATTVLETNGSTHNGTNADEISNSANIALTVQGIVADFNTVSIAGGTGADTLLMTADSGTASLTSTSAINTITINPGTTDATKTAIITNAVVATGNVMVVDASLLTNTAASFTFRAEGGQLGAVSVTGGSGINTIDLTNLAGNNTVTGGSNDDVITGGTGNDSLSGGAGNDTYTMVANLTNADTITDSSGTADTLTATITSLTATTGALKISGVEKLNLTNAGTATIDATNISGASTLNLAGASTATTLTGLAAGLQVGLGFAGGATSLSSGSVSIALANSSSGSDALTINLKNTAANDAILTETGIETVTLAVAAEVNANQTLNVSGLNATTLNITGSAAATSKQVILGTLSTSTTTLDASGFTAITTATASATGTTVKVAGGVVDVIDGGAGNDTFVVTAAGTKALDLDGKSGTDTLTISSVTGNLNFTSVAAFETINLVIAGGTSVTPSNYTGFNGATVTTINVTGGGSGASLTFGGVSLDTALTKFDASGFSGTETLTYTTDLLDNTVTVKGGSGASDVITAGYATAATYAPTISGFETVNFAADNDNTGTETDGFNLAGVTGASTVAFATSTVGVTTVNVTNYDRTSTLQLGHTSGGVADTIFQGASTLGVTLANAAGSTDALNLKLVDTNDAAATITITATGVEIININAGASTSVENHAINLAGVATTSSAAQTINLTGGMSDVANGTALTIADVNASATVIDATNYIGDLVLSDRGSSAMTITGGTGADNLRMENASDVLDGATQTTGLAATNGDTLSIATSTLSGQNAVVDLSSTGDQLTSFKSANNTAIQKGFENVDGTNYTGGGGLDVTGSTAANIITGSPQVDVIVGGGGADTISGLAGADTITLGTGVQHVLYSTTTDMGTYAAGLYTGADGINSFTAGAGGDVISIAGSLIGDGNTTLITAGAALNTVAITGGLASTDEIVVGSDAFANTADVITAIQEVTSVTGILFAVFVTDTDGVTAGNQSYGQLWYDANPDVNGGEYLVATFTDIVTLAGIQAFASPANNFSLV